MMKAFLIILVILVILAGVAFYFGWVQIQLPAEHYAVVFTKTSGYDQQVVAPGEFSWRWERLIPTNMTLYVFDLRPQRREISFRGELPSADLYSSVLPENPDFSYRGTAEVVFTVSPESLPSLVQREKLLPEDLGAFLDSSSRVIVDSVVEALRESETVEIPPLRRAAEQELAAAVPDLQVSILDLRVEQLPDRELYELARASYRDLVEVRDRARAEAVERLAEDQVRAENALAGERAELEALREYGQVLEEYPVLLKALAVQKLSGDQVVTIPEFDLETILE